VVLAEKQLKNYSGTFGQKAITYEGGDLFFQLTADRKVKLLPVEKDLFDVEDNLLRIAFNKENDKISGITIINKELPLFLFLLSIAVANKPLRQVFGIFIFFYSSLLIPSLGFKTNFIDAVI
jgi:hypothetical protein